MSTYHLGPLGDFSGKIGNVVGTTWRGKAVMRSVPSSIIKAPSASQQRQRDKFKTVIAFLNPIKELLNVTFGDTTLVKTPFNNATSYHLKEAVMDVNGTWQMLYPKVLISEGTLQGIQQAVLTPMPNHSLQLQWADNSLQAYAHTDDQLLLVVYAPELQSFAIFTDIATRQDGTATLSLPEEFIGQSIETWASFMTATGNKAALSMYIGSYLVG